MAQTVIGFFDDASEAQKAVERLQSSGISRERIDVSRGSEGSTANSSNVTGNTDVNPVSGSARDDNSVRRTSDDRTVDEKGRNTNAITDFFNSLFGGKDDDDSAERYSRVANSSNTIVTVHAQTSEEAENAADILDDAGAIDVDERAAQYGYGSSRSMDRSTERTGVAGDRDTTIERMEENLNVSKRTEESGGVRVRSRIVEKPVEEHIRLREEHVNVERNPVNRPVSGDELNRFQDQDIEMRERTEVPVVNKEARVVEEIKISKDVDERDETIRDNVRHTEVDIDDTDRNNINRNNTTGRDTRLDSDEDNSRGIL